MKGEVSTYVQGFTRNIYGWSEGKRLREGAMRPKREPRPSLNARLEWVGAVHGLELGDLFHQSRECEGSG